MTQTSLSQPCFLNDNRHCLKVVLKEAANALDFLQLSEMFKANPLVEETAIYLSSYSLLVTPFCTYQDEHYLKVFFKEDTQVLDVLALGDSLSTNRLIKETYLRLGYPILSELLDSVTRKLQAQRGKSRLVPFFQKRKEGE